MRGLCWRHTLMVLSIIAFVVAMVISTYTAVQAAEDCRSRTCPDSTQRPQRVRHLGCVCITEPK